MVLDITVARCGDPLLEKPLEVADRLGDGLGRGDCHAAELVPLFAELEVGLKSLLDVPKGTDDSYNK